MQPAESWASSTCCGVSGEVVLETTAPTQTSTQEENNNPSFTLTYSMDQTSMCTENSAGLFQRFATS